MIIMMSIQASGGNENLLCLWDAAMSARSSVSSTGQYAGYEARCRLTHHQAAVKALAWCPWKRNILASGGGTADRTIRIWNSALGTNLSAVDTNSQVCALEWSNTYMELVSSHGFSDNQLILWNYPTMTKVKELHGHTARVLHMAKSPDGRTICSASADETLRFWDVFNTPSSSREFNHSTSFLDSPVSYRSRSSKIMLSSPILSSNLSLR